MIGQVGRRCILFSLVHHAATAGETASKQPLSQSVFKDDSQQTKETLEQEEQQEEH